MGLLIIIGIITFLAMTVIALVAETVELTKLNEKLHNSNRALREQSYKLTIALKKLKSSTPKKKQVKHKRRLK